MLSCIVNINSVLPPILYFMYLTSRTLLDNAAVMRTMCHMSNAQDYSQVLKTFHENVLKVASSAGSGGASSKQKPAELTKAVKAYDIPIIIVPSAPTSAITLRYVVWALNCLSCTMKYGFAHGL